MGYSVIVSESEPGFHRFTIPTTTVSGISFARGDVEKHSTRDEMNQPGVYALFGLKEFLGPQNERAFTLYVYLGKSGKAAIDRLRDHAKKIFWTHAIVCSSRDAHLDESFLESRLIREAKASGRAVIDNLSVPSEPMMSDETLAVAEKFLELTKLIMIKAAPIDFLTLPTVTRFDRGALVSVADIRALESIHTRPERERCVAALFRSATKDLKVAVRFGIADVQERLTVPLPLTMNCKKCKAFRAQVTIRGYNDFVLSPCGHFQGNGFGGQQNWANWLAGGIILGGGEFILNEESFLKTDRYANTYDQGSPNGKIKIVLDQATDNLGFPIRLPRVPMNKTERSEACRKRQRQP